MACRFTRYQDSVKKFIANQSIISKYQFKKELLDLMKDSEYILPITLLTIMNGQQRKNKLKSVHGYFMATGIELLIILIHLTTNRKYKNNKIDIDDNILNTLQTSIVSLINLSLQDNVEILKSHYKTNNIVQILTNCMIQINDKITKITTTIMTTDMPETTKYSFKQDLTKFYFKDKTICEKLKKIKIIPKEFIINFTTETFGNSCRLTLILGWLLGGSSNDAIINLERLGYHLGLMMKLAYDFENIDKDAEDALKNNTTLNYIINYGLQESFELFDECKKKFNEGILMLDITTNTIKEFVDILESKVNIALEHSSPDIRRTSSTASFN